MIFKIILISSLVFITSSCTSANEKNDDVVSTLNSSLSVISLARLGLEFPHTDEQLEICIKHESKGCVDVYNNVKEAKKTILSLPADETLKTTLNIIEETCVSEDPEVIYGICYGGLMTLYFYDSPAQDKIILERISQFPNIIKELTFNNELYWFHNRPKPNLWVEYLSTLDITWEREPGLQKEFVINRFKKSISEVEDEDPWVLREMN